jgi:FkbM family methyltransferase
MTSIGRVRAFIRYALDRPFCSSAPEVKLLGDEGTGWVIHADPQPQTCYCAGVGHDISFDVELAKRTKQPVLVFDPSPIGISTMSRIDSPNIKFFPVGLSADADVVEFSLPENPGEGSYSISRDDVEKVSFECWDLRRIMELNGDSEIDLLKMDIEGFEYDIIDSFLRQRIKDPATVRRVSPVVKTRSNVEGKTETVRSRIPNHPQAPWRPHFSA